MNWFLFLQFFNYILEFFLFIKIFHPKREKIKIWGDQHSPICFVLILSWNCFKFAWVYVERDLEATRAKVTWGVALQRMSDCKVFGLGLEGLLLSRPFPIDRQTDRRPTDRPTTNNRRHRRRRHPFICNSSIYTINTLIVLIYLVRSYFYINKKLEKII